MRRSSETKAYPLRPGEIYPSLTADQVEIGTALDTVRTAQKLADVATEQFADLVSVDLIDSTVGDNEADLRRTVGGVLSAGPYSSPSWTAARSPRSKPGKTDRCCEDSPMARALATGRPSRHAIGNPDTQACLEHDTARARSVRDTEPGVVPCRRGHQSADSGAGPSENGCGSA
ncbi:hypothetical protein FDG2_2666 [Candidatus Protofrankia californiensis]|uniref:Uncharacterized protein n=1 Tax=Candidatus Protofrankia californiensis TaxID=1839754 RepID=A0A1C3NY56_9ACTN|nr:hypothetical protein FDG2_2666 [Candidatus Protofrankia californiensis]